MFLISLYASDQEISTVLFKLESPDFTGGRALHLMRLWSSKASTIFKANFDNALHLIDKGSAKKANPLDLVINYNSEDVLVLVNPDPSIADQIDNFWAEEITNLAIASEVVQPFTPLQGTFSLSQLINRKLINVEKLEEWKQIEQGIKLLSADSSNTSTDVMCVLQAVMYAKRQFLTVGVAE